MKWDTIYVLEFAGRDDGWWIREVRLAQMPDFNSRDSCISFFMASDRYFAESRSEAILRFQIENGEPLYSRRDRPWVKCRTVEECVRSNYEEL